MAAAVRRVVVVGGGIGGLAVTRALRLRGIEAVAVERAAEFVASVGAGFSIAPNGQACLRSLGFGSAIHEIGHPLRSIGYLDRHCSHLMAESNVFQKLEDRYGLGMRSTLRSDLIRELAGPLEADGALHYSREVVALDNEPDRAVVHFADGSREVADLVIGADGINSTVLRLAFPREDWDEPIFSGEHIFYGVVDNAYPPVSPDAETGSRPNIDHPLLPSQFGLRGSYTHLGEFISFPCGKDGTHLVWAQTYAADHKIGGREWGSSENPRAELEEFMNSNGLDADHPLRAVAAVTPNERLLHFPLLFRKHKERWHTGRVCLLGDSCHATLPYAGQGANLAIEDAVVLAQELANHANLEDALQAYYSRRADRTRKVVNMARYIGLMFHRRSSLRAMFTDALARYLVNSGAIFNLAMKEIVDHCPVELPPITVPKDKAN